MCENKKNVFYELLKSDKEKLNKLGYKIYNQNETFKDISNNFTHPEFTKFFKKYFNDWESTKCMIMLIKCYEIVCYECPDMTGYERIAILFKIFTCRNIRTKIIERMRFWISYNSSFHLNDSRSPDFETYNSLTLTQSLNTLKTNINTRKKHCTITYSQDGVDNIIDIYTTSCDEIPSNLIMIYVKQRLLEGYKVESFNKCANLPEWLSIQIDNVPCINDI